MAQTNLTIPVSDKPSWKLRRIAIFGWLIFCLLTIAMILVFGNSTNSLHTSALGWAFGSAAATVFAYAGFATLEDINLAKLVK